MPISEVRDELLRARASAAAGDSQRTVEQIDQALRHLEPERLVTTSEAAQLLGVRSINTVKLWVRSGYLPGVRRGNRVMVPLGAVERLQQEGRVRAVRAAEAMHQESADLGDESGLDDSALRDLASARPGFLPWASMPR